MKCKHNQGTKFEYRKETNTSVELCLMCKEILNTFQSFETTKTELSLPQQTSIPVHIEIEENGLLGELFIKQITLQIALGNENIVLNNKYLTEQCIAICSEVHKCLRHIPWKSWKKSQELEIEPLQSEIVDIWQHLINLTISAGIGTDDLMKIYNNNLEKNYKRIKDGY